MRIEAGMSWISDPKWVELDQMQRFQPPRPSQEEVARQGNFHSDPTLAQSQGWPTAVAWALMTNAYVQELLVTSFGAAAFSNGSNINVAFTAPVYMNDEITTHAIATGTSIVDGADVVNLDLWCVNQDGKRVAIGSADVVIR